MDKDTLARLLTFLWVGGLVIVVVVIAFMMTLYTVVFMGEMAKWALNLIGVL